MLRRDPTKNSLPGSTFEVTPLDITIGFKYPQ